MKLMPWINHLELEEVQNVKKALESKMRYLKRNYPELKTKNRKLEYAIQMLKELEYDLTEE